MTKPNKKLNKDNVLVIGDPHIPFELDGYLDFCLSVQKKYSCGTVVIIGDLVDNHSISYHEHDPDGWSPLQEMEQADKKLKKWFKAFPNVFLTRGNHDTLPDRKGKTAGLPKRAFKPYREIWKLPKGWIDDFEFEINDVKYSHGTGGSGRYPHVLLAFHNRQSTVIGHFHSVAGVEWIANSKDCIFGMCVGCGVDRKSYAFAYGKDQKYKPVVGCGIVTDKGQYAQFIPMNLGKKVIFK
jgi:hypothetical protein